MPPALRSRIAVALVAAATAGAFAAVVASFAFHDEASRRSYAEVFAIPLAIASTWFAVSSRRLGGRAGTAAALAVAGWPVVLGLFARAALARPIAYGSGAGAGLPRLEGFALVGAATVPIASLALAPLLVRAERTLGRVAEAAAPAMLALGAILGAVALARSVRPDPDTYVDRLPVVDRAGVTMARDEDNDLWFLGSGSPRVVRAFRGDPPVEVGVDVRSVARSLGAPVGWVHGAVGGLLIGLVGLVAARELRRRSRAVPGTDATHHGGGVISLPDGTEAVVASATSMPAGPIRVVLAPAGAAYRDAAAAPRAVYPGTVADAREELEARARGASIAVVLSIALTFAPLSIAFGYGLAR